MWDDPVALNRVSVALLLLTLLFAVWTAARLLAETWLPIRSVEVRGAAHVETRQGLRPVVRALSGGLFSVDLEAARTGFESLPWVRSAKVQRVWPGSLSVELEEHRPAAAWNDLAVLNTAGEVFSVKPWPELPRFNAPEGMEKEVAAHYRKFSELLGERRIAGIQVDARRAWRIVLADGITVELGRDRLDERLKRFVTFFPMVDARVAGIRRFDMRYPNGFAVQGQART
jgi:cell division protein FtsQ